MSFRSGPKAENAERHFLKIPSNELFSSVVECDMFDVEKIYNTGKEANKLPVQRLPVFFGNANAISTGASIS